MKRTVTILLTLLLLTVLLALPVSANTAPPPPNFTVYLSNYPPEACYMDVLVQLSPEDADYTDNRDNFPNDSWGGSQIFSYEEDGYVSYTFHYRGAQRYIKINNHDRVEFFANADEKLQRFQSIKIAVLDNEGYILQISEPFDPAPSLFMAVGQGYAYYDYEEDKVEVSGHSDAWLLGVYLAISLAGVVVTVLVEWLIAHCFTPLLLYLKVVLLTNLVTQLTMRILFVLLYSFLWQNYWFWTLLLEVAVYTAEYFTYRKYIPTAPKKTILIYVIVANTVTLLLGIAVNNFLYL